MKVLDLLSENGRPTAGEEALSQLSLVKGLFNRVVREDQWDWFTVARQLGYPSRGLARVIAGGLSELRSAIRDDDDAAFQKAHAKLSRLPVRRCLSVFLGFAKIVDEAGAGWIYILSTRELRDLLKIGMTTRTVETRAQEINGATGVAIPFGVRRCWRVTDPARAEKIVHAALSDYRFRNDREFFRAGFLTAAKIVEEAIRKACLELRTLNALAGLVTS